MSDPAHHEEAMRRLRIASAFAAVYVLWGSTYLAIRFAIETLPPLLMAGARFVVAGALLYGWTRLRGAAPPPRAGWPGAAVVGGLMLLGGNGAVVLAEQRVPSGLAALMVALTPLWMVLLQWAGREGKRPSGRIIMGLVLGLCGVAVLVVGGAGPAAGAGQPVPLWGAGLLLLATLCWSLGSLQARHRVISPVPLQATAMQLLCGGALMLLLGSLRGEWAALHLAQVSLRSALALAYLVVFGSLLGFTAYIFLLRATTPARAATYAYVNPVVAVLLGRLFGGEPISPRTVLAAAAIVSAVVLITTPSRPGR